MKFFKMQAQGNDYLYFDFLDFVPTYNFPDLAKKMCNRHFGVGGDGLVLILPSETADVKMEIYNADGSVAMMCGSALRSIGGYMFLKAKKKSLLVETRSGERHTQIVAEAPLVVKADMGIAGYIYPYELWIEEYRGHAVSVGNPHFIILDAEISSEKAEAIGKKIVTNKYFPEGINIELLKITGKNEAEVFVYERGSGITLACGTGAAACFWLGHTLEFLSNPATIKLPGGSVKTELSEGRIFLTGQVDFVFSGEYEN